MLGVSLRRVSQRPVGSAEAAHDLSNCPRPFQPPFRSKSATQGTRTNACGNACFAATYGSMGMDWTAQFGLALLQCSMNGTGTGNCEKAYLGCPSIYTNNTDRVVTSDKVAIGPTSCTKVTLPTGPGAKISNLNYDAPASLETYDLTHRNALEMDFYVGLRPGCAVE